MTPTDCVECHRPLTLATCGVLYCAACDPSTWDAGDDVSAGFWTAADEGDQRGDVARDELRMETE